MQIINVALEEAKFPDKQQNSLTFPDFPESGNPVSGGLSAGQNAASTLRHVHDQIGGCRQDVTVAGHRSYWHRITHQLSITQCTAHQLTKNFYDPHLSRSQMFRAKIDYIL